MKPGLWIDLGLREYGEVWELQKQLVSRRQQDLCPDLLLLLEHPPVVTIGRRASARQNVLDESLPLFEIERGGDVTYHGPGQLVGYPIVRLRGGVIGHVTAMARAVASVMGELGIDAEWRRETPGVWVGGAKICAFGVHVHRRVTIHGFALNVSGALDGFDLIVPCGLRATRTTSIAAALPAGRTVPPLHLLASRVAGALGRELGVPFVPRIESPALNAIAAVEMSERIVRMIQA